MITNVYPSAGLVALTGNMTTNLRLVLMTSSYVYSPIHDGYSDLTGMVVNASSPSGGYTLTNVRATAVGTSTRLSADCSS